MLLINRFDGRTVIMDLEPNCFYRRIIPFSAHTNKLHPLFTIDSNPEIQTYYMLPKNHSTSRTVCNSQRLQRTVGLREGGNVGRTDLNLNHEYRSIIHSRKPSSYSRPAGFCNISKRMQVMKFPQLIPRIEVD